MPSLKWVVQRGAVVAQLAVLSMAFTSATAGVGLPVTGADTPSDEPVADTEARQDTVPQQAIEAPVRMPDRQQLGLAVGGDTEQIVASSSTNAIPAAALAAYQRAESVINRADESCDLTWQLVAAIGRVESDHGRVQGNSLDDEGVATPGIFGIPLDGDNGTRAIRDTDVGQFDSDTVWDRAVGPMQFIPGTWSTVGVDADGDGQRDPQDIDDSALATAVYLCSGEDDLSTPVGQRAAVYRYNHSQSYVDLVQQIMEAYLDGDFTPVPNGTVSAGQITKLSGGDGITAPGGDADDGAAPGAADAGDEPELAVVEIKGKGKGKSGKGKDESGKDDGGQGNGGQGNGGKGNGGKGDGDGSPAPDEEVVPPAEGEGGDPGEGGTGGPPDGGAGEDSEGEGVVEPTPDCTTDLEDTGETVDDPDSGALPCDPVAPTPGSGTGPTATPSREPTPGSEE